MQIDRLFEIVYLLLERETLTARELAARFEVSTRTIYRDVESLSAAGIPIYMSRGQGGGIRLMPEFVLDRAVLSQEERGAILAALQGMRAVDALSDASVLSKIRGLFRQEGTSWIEINFGDWGGVIQGQFEAAKQAILRHRVLEFEYVSVQGARTLRQVEPVKLWFKDKSWYLWAYCLERGAMRLFRLSRMRRVRCTGRCFMPREGAEDWIDRQDAAPATEITMRVAARMGYRVLDEFQEADVRPLEGGDFEVTMRFVEDEWVYGYILSFGSAAQVLSPRHVREGVRLRLEESLKIYSE